MRTRSSAGQSNSLTKGLSQVQYCRVLLSTKIIMPVREHGERPKLLPSKAKCSRMRARPRGSSRRARLTRPASRPGADLLMEGTPQMHAGRTIQRRRRRHGRRDAGRPAAATPGSDGRCGPGIWARAKARFACSAHSRRHQEHVPMGVSGAGIVVGHVAATGAHGRQGRPGRQGSRPPIISQFWEGTEP